MPPKFEIRKADGAEDMAIAADLFREYQTWLDVDLCYQDFEAELVNVAEMYAPPRGVIFIASVNGDDVGVGALRPVSDTCCEMKRVYVRESARGSGIGKTIIDLLITHGKTSGYASMILDTLPKLKTAQAIYKALGFQEIPAYYKNPLPGVVYYEKIL
ncbi:GNAT family N-acetyltransferase [Rhodospirillales bacterium]|nr:GNAT family N-acetyltransferase [Rhodospirillales bacterium]